MLVAHWQRICKGDCPICWSEALKLDAERADWLRDTGMTLRVLGQVRSVYSIGTRLYVGECLSKLNPSGRGGKVWSAPDLEALKFNVDFDPERSEREYSS